MEIELTTSDQQKVKHAKINTKDNRIATSNRSEMK